VGRRRLVVFTTALNELTTNNNGTSNQNTKIIQDKPAKIQISSSKKLQNMLL